MANRFYADLNQYLGRRQDQRAISRLSRRSSRRPMARSDLTPGTPIAISMPGGSPAGPRSVRSSATRRFSSGPDGLGRSRPFDEVTRPETAIRPSNSLARGLSRSSRRPWRPGSSSWASAFRGVSPARSRRRARSSEADVARLEEHRPTGPRSNAVGEFLVRDQREDVREDRLRHDRDSSRDPRAGAVSTTSTSFEVGTFEATRTCSERGCKTPRPDTSTTSVAPTSSRLRRSTSISTTDRVRRSRTRSTATASFENAEIRVAGRRRGRAPTRLRTTPRQARQGSFSGATWPS